MQRSDGAVPVSLSGDATALYDTVAGRFGALLEGCPPDRWDAPSPCPGWTARDVAAHVVRNHRRAVAAIDRSQFAPPAADEDVVRAWYSARAAVADALRDPDRAGTVLGERFGSLTFTDFVVRMAVADTLIHTWDLARATGQDDRLEPEAVELATLVLAPEDDGIRLPEVFGMKVDPHPAADPQTRLLNFLGRQV